MLKISIKIWRQTKKIPNCNFLPQIIIIIKYFPRLESVNRRRPLGISSAWPHKWTKLAWKSTTAIGRCLLKRCLWHQSNSNNLPYLRSKFLCPFHPDLEPPPQSMSRIVLQCSVVDKIFRANPRSKSWKLAAMEPDLWNNSRWRKTCRGVQVVRDISEIWLPKLHQVTDQDSQQVQWQQRVLFTMHKTRLSRTIKSLWERQSTSQQVSCPAWNSSILITILMWWIRMPRRQIRGINFQIRPHSTPDWTKSRGWWIRICDAKCSFHPSRQKWREAAAQTTWNLKLWKITGEC